MQFKKVKSIFLDKGWVSRYGAGFSTQLRLFVLKLIKIYQKTLSFDHGIFRHFFPYGYCRFHPTCSEYGYRAVEEYGIIKGGLMAVWRILRCNPWGKGGEDPV